MPGTTPTRLEPPNYRLRSVRQDPLNWVQSQAPGSSVLFYDLNKWAVEGGIEDLRRNLIAHLDTLPRGAQLVTVSRVADSGKELAAWLTATGVTNLGWANLTAHEIRALPPPSAGVLLVGTRVYRKPRRVESEEARELVRNFVAEVRRSPAPLDIRGELPDKFVTTLLDIGLIWKKK